MLHRTCIHRMVLCGIVNACTTDFHFGFFTISCFLISVYQLHNAVQLIRRWRQCSNDILVCVVNVILGTVFYKCNHFKLHDTILHQLIWDSCRMFPFTNTDGLTIMFLLRWGGGRWCGCTKTISWTWRRKNIKKGGGGRRYSSSQDILSAVKKVNNMF